MCDKTQDAAVQIYRACYKKRQTGTFKDNMKTGGGKGQREAKKQDT